MFGKVKHTTLAKTVALSAALLLASGAFATTKASLQLTNPVTVNGTKLKPGDYKLQWEGSGPNVELTIMQGKTVLATASAHVISLDNAPVNNAAVTTKSDDGTTKLAGVRFAGKKLALDLGESSDNMQSGSAK